MTDSTFDSALREIVRTVIREEQRTMKEEIIRAISAQVAIAAQSGSTQDGPKIINVRELARMLETSERSIDRMIARGDLPQPMRVGLRRVWASRIIDDWLGAGPRRRRRQA